MTSKRMIPFGLVSDYKNAFDNMDISAPEAALDLYSEYEYDDMEFSTEAFLYKTIKEELTELVSYEEYLKGITDTAKRMTSVSIFADKDSFTYRNAIKTADVYDKLKGKINIEAGPSKGMELWSGNGFTGLIIMLVMLMIINEMIIKDRESGQMNLLFTMEKGRGVHGFIKIMVCFFSAFIVTFFVLLTACVSCSFIFGIGNILRPIQSIVGLKGCTMEVSVLGYMLIYFLLMALAAAVISIIFFLIASKFKTSVYVYFGITAVAGIEAVLYYLIKENSYLAFFREFNLLSFLNPGRYLSLYGNISLLGYPVNRLIFVICSLALIVFILLPLAVKIYSVQSTITVQKKEDGIPLRMLKKGRLQSVSVFGHESYKLFVCGGVLGVLTLFVLYSVLNFTPEREYFENESAVYYKNYALAFQGEITEDTLKAMEKERKRYDDIRDEMRKVLSGASPELAGSIATQYQDMLKPEAGLELLFSKLDVLKENGGYILYDTGYRMLSFDRVAERKELTMAITASLMLVLSLTFLFAGDDSIHIDRVTSVCINGRRRLYIKKIVIGMMVSLIIWCINFLPYMISVLNVYGCQGLEYPAQSVSTLSGTIFEKLNMTVRGSMIVLCFLKYMGLVAELFILSAVSKKIRSIGGTMVAGICLLAGPLMLAYVLL
ncbi:MAG: hypothetical protein J5522_10235 [Lachnospiraceae bacterium]|nr:hypothetical protein [Lachnospiraceae bacterium]